MSTRYPGRRDVRPSRLSRHPVLALLTGVVVGFMLLPFAYDLLVGDWRGLTEAVATTAAFLFLLWWAAA